MTPAFAPAILTAALALATLPSTAFAQFTDPFTSPTIDLAWVTNRYEPAGFDAVIFDGDRRLRLTLDGTTSRPPAFSGSFYNTQGRERDGNITGLWTLSAQVFVASAFNTTTGTLASSALWGHTGTTPAGGAYAILGFTNESPTATLNPSATDRSFRFQAFNVSAGGWIDLGVPSGFVFDTWHTLSASSTGTAFEFRIDGALVLTQATSAGNDLLSAMVQGYNFGEAGNYSVYWDNVTATAIPEPASGVLASALAALGFVAWRRRRASPNAHPLRD